MDFNDNNAKRLHTPSNFMNSTRTPTRLSKSLGIFQSRRDRDFDQISRRDYRDFETFKKSKKAQHYTTWYSHILLRHL